MKRLVPLLLFLVVVFSTAAQGQYRPAELPLRELPVEHDYQRALRQFLETLSEQDLTVERALLSPVPLTDAEEQYRLWLLSKQIPEVRAATLPALSFTLRSIESRPGLSLPTTISQCQNLAWLASWNYAGNPYHGSLPLKRRAAALAMVDLVMLDYLYEHDPQGSDRADFLGGNLIWLGYTFSRVQDILPTPAREAFIAGLKKHVLRLEGWGPRGLMTDMDLFAPVGLRYLYDAIPDTSLRTAAERYARRLFTEPAYFHPAGYFVDSGCFDTSYNGISLYFGTWSAVMGDWDFARQALDKAYRLRAHLCFPAPDGVFTGPSQMSSRTSADPPHDQWQFPSRHLAAGMAAEEGLYLAPLPSAEGVQAAPDVLAATLNAQLSAAAPPDPQPWRETHWSRAINFAYEHYQKGYYARRLQLQRDNSPLLKPLYLRDESFVREFDKAFVIARFPGWAAAIHTGPVGKGIGYQGLPYGYGGGQLSVFWTPATGAALVGRRRGVQGAAFDRYEEWRQWPIHAVTGQTEAGELLTSARIENPEVKTEMRPDRAVVRVRGALPKYNTARAAIAPSQIQYERVFRAQSRALRVKTTLTGAGSEHLRELYETLPVFLREQADQKAATIRFRVKNVWQEAETSPVADVRAVRIEHFDGMVEIVFSRPVSVRLAPQPWLDGFQTRAECQTVLVDLLGGASKPGAFRSASLEYTISPAAVPGSRRAKNAGGGG